MLALGLLLVLINLFAAVMDIFPARPAAKGEDIARLEKRLTAESDKAAFLFFQPISINRADKELFAAIPGIGPALGREIVALRARKNSFTRLEELREVKGIGPKKLKNLKKYCCL